MTKILHVMVLTIMISMSISLSQSYGETNNEFTKSEGNDITNNPVAKSILKNIEIARKEFANTIQKEKEKNDYQNLIDTQRKVAQASLEEELANKCKEYIQNLETRFKLSN